MGENEQGSLLRTTLSIAVYGLIASTFIGMLYIAINYNIHTHQQAYEVN